MQSPENVGRRAENPPCLCAHLTKEIWGARSSDMIQLSEKYAHFWPCFKNDIVDIVYKYRIIPGQKHYPVMFLLQEVFRRHHIKQFSRCWGHEKVLASPSGITGDLLHFRGTFISSKINQMCRIIWSPTQHRQVAHFTQKQKQALHFYTVKLSIQ